MTATPSALDRLADRLGILPGYRAFDGTVVATSADTKRALLAAMGWPCASDGDAAAALAGIAAAEAAHPLPQEITIRAGTPATVPLDPPVGRADWRLVADGTDEPAAEGAAGDAIALPPLAVGIYRLALGDHDEIPVLAVPARAPSVDGVAGVQRLWGVSASLYGLRSARNLGLGDYADLGAAAVALARHGADFLGINPVHASGTVTGAAISPYSPSHRAFYATAHIAPDRVPGFAASDAARCLLDEAAPLLARTRGAEFVDYPDIAPLQHRLLEAAWDAFERAADPDERAAFDAFVAAGGAPLHDFATHEAIAELHGPSWTAWPDDLQAPDAPGVAPLAARLAPRIRFHAWLQWLASGQLAAAQAAARSGGMRLGLYLDLAVGARFDGAEVWANRAAFPVGVAQGSPADAFTEGGQNWALAPFSPAGLRATGYRPFIANLRATMRHAGLIRIDHILGFSRAFWLPDSGEPGAFVRYPIDTLLAITAIEATRAGAVVVGEDLGLTEPELSARVRAAGLYGCAVTELEREHDGSFRPPEHYARQSLASFANHDLPTLRGFCLGRDLDWLERLDRIHAPDAPAIRAGRAADARALARLAGSDEDETTVPPEAAHAALARSPAAMIAVQLDDVFETAEQQNLPGTIDEHPNWRRRFAVPVEDLADDPRLVATGRILGHLDECRDADNDNKGDDA